MTLLTDPLKEVLNAGHLAHMVTLNEDGSPQVTVIWIGTDGDEIVSAHFGLYKKLRNLQRDPRVSLSLEIGGKNEHGLDNYLVIEGTATITEGGAAELLQRFAQVYMGQGSKWPPGDETPPAGYVVRIKPDHIRGVSPWT
ncbi:PPOX class F420-dependent oxidoreductase [Fodinicola feengrottensis]|uniref:PPOX class F420-dependent oxidoreductase n=1 Tax=Fodinicola feengrottensis TaxID=435914 RepID=A0ABN2H4G4_9ACTN|nr:PPOX class F420-dependent oxidoreductase [Fodinicola feengrottensis]